MSATIVATPSIAPKRRAEDIPLSRRMAAFAFFLFADFFYGWSWNTVDLLRPDIRGRGGNFPPGTKLPMRSM